MSHSKLTQLKALQIHTFNSATSYTPHSKSQNFICQFQKIQWHTIEEKNLQTERKLAVYGMPNSLEKEYYNAQKFQY